MGYLNNSSVTVDAILTKKGRELLAKGRNEFKITKFALADDEIDYSLWNPTHPLGSAYYGIIIENMPLVEATPDESQIMKYKLVTLPRRVARMPILDIGSNLSFRRGGESRIVSPNMINFPEGNSTLGYTAILSDSDTAELTVAAGKTVAGGTAPAIPQFVGLNESAQSVTVVGREFRIRAKSQPISDKSATLTIIGNETGGRATINISVLQDTIATAGGGNIFYGGALRLSDVNFRAAGGV